MNRTLILSAALTACTGGCANYYRVPDVPASQLASVTVDARATLLSVDGLSPPPLEWKSTRLNDGQKKPPHTFPVGTGCRSFTATYEETYEALNKQEIRQAFAAERETHTYETFRPIRFFVPVRAGYTYWITATFTGDEFLPRVVEIGSNGEATGRFLPDVPCESG
jgi:hypothetical protein